MKKSTATIVSLILIGGAIQSEEIYFWKDRKGNPHYSDKAVDNAEKLVVSPGVGYRVVDFVFDGDTVSLDDRSKVRLLGINTPEIESRRKSGEPGGEQAKAWLKRAIEGKKVRLDRDVHITDNYGRTLAHLFTETGTHVNWQLVRLGLATVNLHPPNLKYAQQLLDAQQRAEREKLGIWGNPAYAPQPIEQLPSLQRRGWQRLVGRARKIQRGRKFHRLIYSRSVDVRIPRANLALFPDLNSYLDRETEIRGWPSRRKKHYSILIRHPSALKLSGDS